MSSYSKLEEEVNSITHYIGVAFGFFAMGALVVKGSTSGNIGYLVGSIIFCFSMIILYSMSGTYHILKNEKLKRIFKILDHCAIFLLISGSYTPFLLGVFSGKTKWIFFGIQWGLTIIGIILKIFYTGRFEVLSTLVYLFMGWMITFVWKDLKMNVTPLALKYMMLGGASYTIGTIFYLSKKIKFAHAIWHLFVLAGSLFIFFAVYFMI